MDMNGRGSIASDLKIYCVGCACCVGVMSFFVGGLVRRTSCLCGGVRCVCGMYQVDSTCEKSYVVEKRHIF